MRFKFHAAHLTHKQALWLAASGVVLVCTGEAMAAFHCWTQRDLVTSSLVVLGWFKEGIRPVFEKLVSHHM